MPMFPNLPECLYHGSAEAFVRIDVNRGRDRKDFGKGFYMAYSRDQAIGMMHKKYEEMITLRRDGSSAGLAKTLYMIVLNVEAFSDLRVREFATADRTWFDFILMCRAKGGLPHDYDVVIGPTADDNTNLVLKNYLDGIYGDPFTEKAKAFALDMLEPQNLGRQLFSGRQNVIDRIVASFEPIDWRSC